MASDHLDDFSDEEFVQRIQSGDIAAFNVLYQRYRNQVYRWAMARVGPEDAWDITQETLWKAYRRLSTLQSASNFKSWLFTLTKNTSIDHLRKQGREPREELDDDEMAQQSPEDYVIWKEQVQEAIQGLKPHYRAVLRQSMWGYTPKEIAQQLQLSLGSVRTYLSDARRELRRTLHTYLSDARKELPQTFPSRHS